MCTSLVLIPVTPLEPRVLNTLGPVTINHDLYLLNPYHASRILTLNTNFAFFSLRIPESEVANNKLIANGGILNK